MASELRETIPTFGKPAEAETVADAEIGNMSAISSVRLSSSALEVAVILLVAIIVIGGAELAVRVFDIKAYVVPKPSSVARTLVTNFDLFWPHIVVTVKELLTGYFIGASIGLLLAAVITQFPFVEKVITPYILLLVMTPMIALVPLLILQFGFGSAPRIIAVSLAVGPMVMINSATGFRRTDLAKIALARSYGASTLQIFMKVRFPLAMPMIIVGLMVGAIFGMLTAVGAEMSGGSEGIGTRLVYYYSRIQIANFFSLIIILAVMGILIYVIFYWVGKRWASWQA